MMIGIFLDIEANGLDNQRHRSLELAYQIVELTTKKVLSSYSKKIFQPKEIWQKSDPISLQVNGFKEAEHQDGLTEEEVKKAIIQDFQKHHIHRDHAVYICQNPSFDRAFFSQIVPSDLQEDYKWPYHWLDLASMFWALQLEKHETQNARPPWEIGISKNSIAEHLNLPKEKAPHRAMQGVEHLIDCYFALLKFSKPLETKDSSPASKSRQ